MGGVIRSVFGGSSSKGQSKSESGNLAYPFIQETFGPLSQYASQAGGALSNLLGLNGSQNQQEAVDNFRDTPGYQFQQDQGQQAVQNRMSGAGTFNSGATAKALMQYSQGLADNSYNSYLDHILGLGNIGLQVGNLLGSAGQYSKGMSSYSGTNYTGGLGKAIGAALPMIF